jgi:hypothetical protein
MPGMGSRLVLTLLTLLTLFSGQIGKGFAGCYWYFTSARNLLKAPENHPTCSINKNENVNLGILRLTCLLMFIEQIST